MIEPAKHPVRRCAIYTRKSSDKGLEQDFNSLHAQCERLTREPPLPAMDRSKLPPSESGCCLGETRNGKERKTC
jgi:hypothetical protein